MRDDAATGGPVVIEVEDFGPIRKARVELRPLTVFVGPNDSGKSYLATLIYALHRWFSAVARAPAEPPPGKTRPSQGPLEVRGRRTRILT